MKTEKLVDLIGGHLQEVNNDKVERLKRIDKMLTFLNYNRRLTELSEEEMENFIYCNEGFPWTEEMRAAYAKCTNQKSRYEYITMVARTTYFRLCLWQNYLYGDTQDKPFVEKKKHTDAA